MKFLGHYVYLPIVLLVVAELVVAVAAFSVADFVWVSLAVPPEGQSTLRVVLWAVGFAAAVVLGLTAVGLYQPKQRLRIEGVLARMVVGLGISGIVLACADFIFPTGVEGPLWAVSLGLALVLLGVTRTLLWRWVDHEMFQRRVLVYGAGKRAASLLKLRRRSDRRGFNIDAFVQAPGDQPVISDGRVLSAEGSLFQYAQASAIDEIVIAMDDRRQGFPISELLQCRFAGIAVVDLLTFLERETGKLHVELVNPSWLIFSERFGSRQRFEIAWRVIDFVSASVFLVLGAPFMLAVAIAVLLDDGRPIFYRQQRVGLRGRTFTLYKFRSMGRNAEADGKAQWAGRDDSRVTRVGRVIRKLRLDELPQLINVLSGSMSLVGPRPERPEFVEQLAQKIPYYHERHLIKPGITGWAQLCYPYGSSDHDAMEKLAYDLFYIKHRSLIFDVMVLLQTAEVVLWGKGAR